MTRPVYAPCVDVAFEWVRVFCRCTLWRLVGTLACNGRESYAYGPGRGIYLYLTVAGNVGWRGWFINYHPSL